MRYFRFDVIDRTQRSTITRHHITSRAETVVEPTVTVVCNKIGNIHRILHSKTSQTTAPTELTKCQSSTEQTPIYTTPSGQGLYVSIQQNFYAFVNKNSSYTANSFVAPRNLLRVYTTRQASEAYSKQKSQYLKEQVIQTPTFCITVSDLQMDLYGGEATVARQDMKEIADPRRIIGSGLGYMHVEPYEELESGAEAMNILWFKSLEAVKGRFFCKTIRINFVKTIDLNIPNLNHQYDDTTNTLYIYGVPEVVGLYTIKVTTKFRTIEIPIQIHDEYLVNKTWIDKDLGGGQ